jgi:hypothetical protein
MLAEYPCAHSLAVIERATNHRLVRLSPRTLGPVRAICIGHCQTEVIRLAGEARTGKHYNKRNAGTVAADVNQWLTQAAV